jgi:alpha amylase
MVGFQEVVEIWGVYWFGRRLGRGWHEKRPPEKSAERFSGSL